MNQMKVCFICDASSIHSRNLINFFLRDESVDVFIISSKGILPIFYPSLDQDKVRFLSGSWVESYAGVREPFYLKTPQHIRILMYNLYLKIQKLKFAVLPLIKQSRIRKYVSEFNPDIVHVLRLPLEGYLASRLNHPNMIATLWGNDFVYWAHNNRMLRYHTQKLMGKLKLLLPDTTRDKYLSELFGYDTSKNIIVMPAQGGLQPEQLDPIKMLDKSKIKKELGFEGRKLVLANRGFNNWYIDCKPFVRAASMLVKEDSSYLFFIEGNVNTVGFMELNALVQELNLHDHIILKRHQREDYLKLIRATDIVISLTKVDGLPMSLLESMYLETFPIMTFHRSYDGWLEEGNNCIMTTNTESAIADSIKCYYSDFESEKESWIRFNMHILKTKANYSHNLDRLKSAYLKLVG